MHANAMGDYDDAPKSRDKPYDICPGYNGDCGDNMTPGSIYCVQCSGQARADEQEREWTEANVPQRQERHKLIKAGLMPNRLLGESVAPIVHEWWESQ